MGSVGKLPVVETNLYQYSLNDPINKIDPLGLFSLEDVSDFSAGFGDTITFGATEWIRDRLSQSLFGDTNTVNKCSGAYTAGEISGYAWDVGMGGAAAGRALSVEVNAFSKGNVFKIISKRLKAGFRIDPAHHGQGWGHSHFWRW